MSFLDHRKFMATQIVADRRNHLPVFKDVKVVEDLTKRECRSWSFVETFALSSRCLLPKTAHRLVISMVRSKRSQS